jgi:hypothetical protein
MDQTQRLERPGARESAVTGNHIYEKTSHRDSDDARRRRSRRTSLTRKAWTEDRGRAPNAKQGDIVRKQGAEIAIGDLRDRASLDAALKDVDAVFYIEPAFWSMRLRSARAWSMGPTGRDASARNSSADEGKRVGAHRSEYGITVDVLTRGPTVTPSTKKIFPSELPEGGSDKPSQWQAWWVDANSI